MLNKSFFHSNEPNRILLVWAGLENPDHGAFQPSDLISNTCMCAFSLGHGYNRLWIVFFGGIIVLFLKVNY